jgi:ribosomal protein L31E
LTKGTFFYDLRKSKSVIMSVMKDLAEGKSQRAIHRTTGVNPATQSSWLLRAADHVTQISDFLEHEMHVERVQIDEFWSFVLKKKSILPKRKN